jgi:hypothetical protein
MIEIEQKWIKRFYFDPVMEACIIGAKLKTFQKGYSRLTSNDAPGLVWGIRSRSLPQCSRL